MSTSANPSSSPWRQSGQRLLANRVAMGAFAFLIFMLLACVSGPWILPHEYDQQNLALGATPPSAQHWFGTDTLGRDLLVRMLDGGRISLAVGLVATLVATLVGVTYGSVAALAGGNTDRALMRFVEILYALPFTVFIILLMVVFERSLLLIFVAIGAVEWLTMARIVRGQVLKLKTMPFIEAARASGQSFSGLVRKHLLPNLAGIVIVYATLTVPGVMLLEAFISFLGLGVQAPHTSWGDLIKQGAETMEEYPWLLTFPCLIFASTLLALNFLGDGLRDALDPRSEIRG